LFGRKERKRAFVREPLSDLEDLRDDCIALFLDSGMTQKDIHAAGGPTPATISKWLYKETRFPRLDTIRSFMLAVGYDLAPMPRWAIEEQRRRPIEERLQLRTSILGQPRMPKKGKK